MHCKQFDDKANQDVLIPADMMVSLIPSIEKLVLENQLNVDLAKNILSTRILPYSVRQLLYQNGINISLQLQHSQSVSPLNLNLKLNNSNNIVNSPNQNIGYYQHIQSFETQGLEQSSHSECSSGNNGIKTFKIIKLILNYFSIRLFQLSSTAFRYHATNK